MTIKVNYLENQLQILWLGEPIKAAIQTSLGVIILTAISACIGHLARQFSVRGRAFLRNRRSNRSSS